MASTNQPTGGNTLNGTPASSFEAVKVKETGTDKSKYREFDGKSTPSTAEEFIQRAKDVAELLAIDVADVSQNA